MYRLNLKNVMKHWYQIIKCARIVVTYALKIIVILIMSPRICTRCQHMQVLNMSLLQVKTTQLGSLELVAPLAYSKILRMMSYGHLCHMRSISMLLKSQLQILISYSPMGSKFTVFFLWIWIPHVYWSPGGGLFIGNLNDVRESLWNQTP